MKPFKLKTRYVLLSNHKTDEGKHHPDSYAQFQHISRISATVPATSATSDLSRCKKEGIDWGVQKCRSGVARERTTHTSEDA